MKPIITVYSPGSSETSKKFEGYIAAAFWIGVDHAEGDVGSVKIRQPVESYDSEVAELQELAALMVQRQISFAVEFFTEPTAPEATPQSAVSLRYSTETIPEVVVGGDSDFESELVKIKEELRQGTVTKRQYEAKKGAILKKWKEKVEGRMGS